MGQSGDEGALSSHHRLGNVCFVEVCPVGMGKSVYADTRNQTNNANTLMRTSAAGVAQLNLKIYTTEHC